MRRRAMYVKTMTNSELESEWSISLQPITKEDATPFSTLAGKISSVQRVFIVLPCFNEEKNLTVLVDDICGFLSSFSNFEIIAVNDGSSDKSDSILKNLAIKYPIRILHHDKNMGLSAALRDGLFNAAANAKLDDLVITMDADNTHKSFYIRGMLEAVRQGAEIVIASRYVKGGLQIGVPLNRILLSKSLNYFLNLWCGLKIRDVTSGYRCYRASVLKKGLEKYNSHLVDSKGFEVQVELIVKLASLSKKTSEIPFKLRYDEKNGKSKMHLSKTIRNYFLLLPKIVIWRFIENS